MNKCLLVTIFVALTGTAAAVQARANDALIARAKSFELDTPYVPPPGDPLSIMPQDLRRSCAQRYS